MMTNRALRASEQQDGLAQKVRRNPFLNRLVNAVRTSRARASNTHIWKVQ